jgi:hypothetical protein
MCERPYTLLSCCVSIDGYIGKAASQLVLSNVGDIEKLVYCAGPAAADARDRLGPVATFVDAGDTVEMRTLTADLAARGVDRVLLRYALSSRFQEADGGDGC